MLIEGSKLNDNQRSQVLAAFGYRWTRENYTRACSWYGACPICGRNAQTMNDGVTGICEGGLQHNHPILPLVSDEYWLAEHAFHFIANGSRMMANRRFAGFSRDV